MTAQQKQLNVLVIGDVCRDITELVSKKPNYESEAYAANSLGNNDETWGMAGNVFYCLQMLGIQVDFLGTKLDDRCVKTRYVEAYTGKTLFRLDKDIVSPPCDLFWCGSYDAIVISDYNKGFVTEETILYVQDKFEGPIFLDTKKQDISKFTDCFIKINLNEHRRIKKTNTKLARYIVTRGELGAEENEIQYPALQGLNILDTCGAGDAFLAGLVYGYFNDRDNDIDYGIVNSGLSIEHVGTYAPSEHDLLEGIKKYRDQTYRNS